MDRKIIIFLVPLQDTVRIAREERTTKRENKRKEKILTISPPAIHVVLSSAFPISSSFIFGIGRYVGVGYSCYAPKWCWWPTINVQLIIIRRRDEEEKVKPQSYAPSPWLLYCYDNIPKSSFCVSSAGGGGQNRPEQNIREKIYIPILNSHWMTVY